MNYWSFISLHKHFLSEAGRSDATVAEQEKAKNAGWGLETGWAHGEFFVWKGDWYHIWCKYRDRSHDKIRDCFIAPVSYDENGLMHDDLSQLDDKYR